MSADQSASGGVSSATATNQRDGQYIHAFPADVLVSKLESHDYPCCTSNEISSKVEKIEADFEHRQIELS